jgi:hypothetical protein
MGFGLSIAKARWENFLELSGSSWSMLCAVRLEGQSRANVVLLSYGTWLHHFGAGRDVIGKTIELNDNPYTAIGVLPQSFSFAPGGDAEFWVPINKLTAHERFRNFYNFGSIGRLHTGPQSRPRRSKWALLQSDFSGNISAPDVNRAPVLCRSLRSSSAMYGLFC